jgi:hypothetical protein
MRPAGWLVPFALLLAGAASAEVCAEARFQLEHCDLTRLDGDGDGIPCETLCGGH